MAKSFGAVHAVKGLDIGIDRGTTVALLGPNGAGKSTTIDMLLGLTRPDAGSVTVFGRAPADAVAAGTGRLRAAVAGRANRRPGFQRRHEFRNAMRAVARGKTVLFATHYLEEADAYADWIILMADGRVVADGPATEIKAKLGVRTIRATLDGRGEEVVPAMREHHPTWRCSTSRFPASTDWPWPAPSAARRTNAS